MKNTGIVRKLDELGRIVLPKELRRTLNIPDGTPLEIGVDGDTILLRKYDPTPSIESSLNQLKSIVDGLPATSPLARKIVDKLAELEEIIQDGDN